jgi:malate dehydrogenase (oxaloacetate-decarboxylating)
VIASQAKHVTENMFMAASNALAKSSPLVNGAGDTLLPALSQIREVSLSIALAVGLQAMEDDVAEVISAQELKVKIKDNFWEPQYRDYRRKFCDK